jgi:hypothetical protein
VEKAPRRTRDSVEQQQITLHLEMQFQKALRPSAFFMPV